MRIGLMLGSLAAVAMPTWVDAHHSFAMFDHVNRVTLAGTVSHFTWSNPHVFIELVSTILRFMTLDDLTLRFTALKSTVNTGYQLKS